MSKDIFFSYGHDEYKKFVLKIQKYLENEGYEVFVDSDKLRAGDDWEYKLEKEIINYDKVVFFITPHSARRPDGYCLNEIAMAMAHGKKIFPVMIRNHILPLSLIRKQFLDMQSCILDEKNVDNSIFLKNMNKLVKAIETNDDFEHGDIQAKVINKFEPIDFQLNYAMHGRIVGREWIMHTVDSWIENHKESKVLWITADAGYGKSAIAAYLSRHPLVMNVHFCDYRGGIKNKPENVIKTLAYSLQQQQIKDYIQEIEYIDISGKKAFELFEELIVNPLSRIKSKDSLYLFVIDGLDETLTDGNMELIELLGSEEFQWGLPDFIKIIITSRPDARLRQALSKLNPLELNTQHENNKIDCLSYIELRLSELEKVPKSSERKSIIETIMKNSDANMLYITKFFEQENIDFSKPSQFPRGLNGIYLNFFRRVTTDIDKYDSEYASMLEVMVAYKEPIPKELLRDILEINQKKLHRILGTFGSMIRENDGTLELYHKSLNDWLISEENEDYFVDVEEGYIKIYKYGKKKEIYKMTNALLVSIAYAVKCKLLKHNDTRKYNNGLLSYVSSMDYLKGFSGLFQKDNRLKSLFELSDNQKMINITSYLIAKKRKSTNLSNLSIKNRSDLYYYFGVLIPIIQISDDNLILSVFNTTKSLYSLISYAETMIGECSTTFHSRIIYTQFLEKVLEIVQTKTLKHNSKFSELYKEVLEEILCGYFLYHEIDGIRALYLSRELYIVNIYLYGKESKNVKNTLESITNIQKDIEFNGGIYSHWKV